MKTSSSQIQRLALITLSASSIALSAYAAEPVANFIPDGRTAQFDTSPSFVPPSQLPLVDSGDGGLAPQFEADKLTSVAVDRNGKTYSATLTEEDRAAFANAVARWSDSSQGLNFGSPEKARGPRPANATPTTIRNRSSAPIPAPRSSARRPTRGAPSAASTSAAPAR
ncbi:MAG: hypothetical protein U1E83_09520 [Methylotetracoccus sp.]